MRIYRDVELVESLGSGIPRILRAYGEACFKFTDNFIRIILPISVQDGTQSAPSRHSVGTQSVPNIENLDKLMVFCTEARTFDEMFAFMGLPIELNLGENTFAHFWRQVSLSRLCQKNLTAGIRSIN